MRLWIFFYCFLYVLFFAFTYIITAYAYHGIEEGIYIVWVLFIDGGMECVQEYKVEVNVAFLPLFFITRDIGMWNCVCNQFQWEINIKI